MTDTNDRTQIAAHGVHRCGSPRCPGLTEDTIAALRTELARVTRERDALRAALDNMTAERDALIAVGEAMLAVVDALPQCECGAPATWRDEYDQTLCSCDQHRDEEHVDLPWAAALRTLDRVSREQGEGMEAREGGVR